MAKQNDVASPLLGEPMEPNTGVKELPDATAEILATLEKEPGDTIRCTRVGRDRYRCNWWAPHAVVGYDNPNLAGRLFTTHRVRKSQFMEVTRTPKGLVIRVEPDAEPGSRSAVATGD